MAEKKEIEKKMKAYLKAGRKAAKGSKRGAKKLRKMATNDIISVVAKKASNHPAWYTKLGGELIGLNYGMIDQLGVRQDLLQPMVGGPVKTPTTTDAIIEVALTAPDNDTLRVAAQKIVNELRLVSGANTIYDVDDMIDYLLNIRSIWVALTQTRRSIRCLNATDPHDIDAWRKYLAMSLNDVSSYGEPTGYTEEFRQKAATTVNWLNTIVKAVRFMMPGNFSLFERTLWMFSNIFVDGTGDKFGAKMFIARDVPIYTHASGSSVHTATLMRILDADKTVEAVKHTIENMISDFTTKVANVAIAGDLMKAYGMQSFYDPGQIGFDEKPSFLYDERALEQIANADVVVGCTCTGAVYQYDGVNSPLTLSGFGFSIFKQNYEAYSARMKVKFVNTSDNEVTPGETLSLTRLKASTEVEYDSKDEVTSIKVQKCGTEVVLNYTYIKGFVTVKGHHVLSPVFWLYGMRPNVSYPTIMEWMSHWSMDDYGPIAFMYDATAADLPGSANGWRAYPIFDFSNWALLSNVEQQQLHTTALLSMMTPSASVVQQAVAVL